MKRTLITSLLSLCLALTANAQIDTVYISNLYTSHLVFTTDLTYADLSNTSVIVAKVVEQNKNMLAVKARGNFAPQTASLTTLESNGDIHTFILAYRAHPEKLIYDTRQQDTRGLGTVAQPSEEKAKVETAKDPETKQPKKKGRKEGGKKEEAKKEDVSEPQPAPQPKVINAKPAAKNGTGVSNLRKEDAPSLEQVGSLPQTLFHIAARSGRIEFVCENIFSYSDITYVTLTLKNNSGVSYETGDATFVVESRNKSKRKVIYEQNIFPKNRFGTLTTASKSKSRITYTLDKMTLAPDQVLKIYLYEDSGRRNLILTLSPDDINLARNPLGN